MLRDTFVFGDSRHRLSLFRTCHQRNRPTALFVRLSLSFFATSSHEPPATSTRPAPTLFGLSNTPGPNSLRPQQLAWPRLSSASATRPAPTLFGLSTRPATAFSSASAPRPATQRYIFDLSNSPGHSFPPNPKSSLQRAPRDAARGSLLVTLPIFVILFSLPQIPTIFLFFCSLFIS